MSVAGEKEKPPESASSQNVTDVTTRFPIEDEDSRGKYEMQGGGTVYRVCLLGDMFESYYALYGLIAVMTGMFTTWVIRYAASTSTIREESDVDEFGTDIDNPEKSPSKEDRRRTNSNEGPDDSRIGTTEDNSTSLQARPESANQSERAKRRLIDSDSESTHSSVDDFADAMDTVEHPDEYPDSYRLSDGAGDISRDQNMEEREEEQYQDQARDDAFLILDADDGSEQLQGNGDANTPKHADHWVEDVNLPEDVSFTSEEDSDSDFGLDAALEDAYAKLDMQDKDEASKNIEERTVDESNSHPPVPVSEDVNLSLTTAEESTPESSAVLESNDDSQKTPDDESEDDGTSVDQDITTVQTSVEYVVVESNDVPNAPVVKNAIDDDVVEDGSDDTTTSSDADTVKDAGVDVKEREHELDWDDRTDIENVGADVIANELWRDEGIEVLNVVADRISNEMVDDLLYGVDGTNKTFHEEDAENVGDFTVQPVDSQEVECVLRYNVDIENGVSDGEKYDANRVSVANVIAESLADEMVRVILKESVIKSRSTVATDDNELPQTGFDKNGEENQLPSVRRVSDIPIPQIRIDSVDDDDFVVEVNVGEDFASPQRGDENTNTSALPERDDDHKVPNDDDLAKEAYKTSDYIPENDENQNQTKTETQISTNMDVTVRVRNDDESESDVKHDVEVNIIPDVQIVATVKASSGDPSDVKDLLTKLTGVDVQSKDAGDEGDLDNDPKLDMVEFMTTIRTNIDDYSGDDDGDDDDVNNHQRQAVDEELISSAAARPVECSSIDSFCSRPQEPGPDLDISDTLSNVPEAPPQKVFEEDLVATDVRKKVNGHVNLKSLLKSLNGELSVDVDLNDSDVGEASPQRKKVITDEMVREAIQYLLQRPFLYSYGMYDSADDLFYNAVIDDSNGGRTFALVSSLFGKEMTPEKKSTIFGLVSSKENLNDDDDDDDLSEVDEPIFPEPQDEEESQINFKELFASLERRPTERDDQFNMPPKQEVEEGYIADAASRELRPTERDDQFNMPPKQEVEEGYIADASGGVEESVPVSSQRVTEGYPEQEDTVPERLGPDTIFDSDDDSSSVSSSDTSGTYILDNQVGLVEEDEEEEQERPWYKEPSYPHDPANQSHEQPGYHSYYQKQLEEEEEEEEVEEEPEKPQASRMFFITSAMLAQASEQQNGESSSDTEYEKPRRQSDSDSSEDYLEEIPPGYGPNSGNSSWPQDPVTQHQYLPADDPTRSYPSEVPTAEYDYDNGMRFRPISGGESSVEPTPRYPTSQALKDNQEIKHPSQNGHHVFSDYDSSSELLEIEKQGQKLFPSSSQHDDNLPPQKIEHLQNSDDKMDYLPARLLPAAEHTVTKKMNYPDETAPTRITDLLGNGALNNVQHLPEDFKPIPEPTITRDMAVPEQLQPVFTRPVFHQGLPEDEPHTQSYESLESYPSRHPEPSMLSGEYAKTNGHTEPLSQSDDSMWLHSDYRGYSGSSEDGGVDYDDDTSFASGERMFALVGLRSHSPPAALSVTASIEVYRAEEHMETQRSLYSYEISKGIAGPEGKMVKLQEQSFSFERHSDIYVESTDSRYDVVISDSVSDSAGEQFLQLGQVDNHPEQLHEQSQSQSFASDRRSDNAEDSTDSPGEGFSLNETVTADFAGEQCAPPGEATDYQAEDFKLDLPFDSAGEELSEREGLQRQVESLSELLSERTLDMQRFKDDYPFLDRIMAHPQEGVAGYEEGQLIGLLETYRQLEEDVLELMNIYKETKTQLTELDQMERA